MNSIDDIFEDGQDIDAAVGQAFAEAVDRHKMMGQPLIVWRDGRVAYVSPEEIKQSLAKAVPASIAGAA